MSNFNVGDKIVAEEIKALKASVKAEMLRRNRSGSLASYGGTTYDFTIIPAVGVRIDREHYSKIRDPISKINTADLPPENPPNIPSLTVLDGKLAIYKADTGKSSTTHHCMASCSGLCYSNCGDGCTSCTAYCAGSCDGDCYGGCVGCRGCSSCVGGCDGGCLGCSSCGSSCGTGCGGKCSGYMNTM